MTSSFAFLALCFLTQFPRKIGMQSPKSQTDLALRLILADFSFDSIAASNLVSSCQSLVSFCEILPWP